MYSEKIKHRYEEALKTLISSDDDYYQNILRVSILLLISMLGCKEVIKMLKPISTSVRKNRLVYTILRLKCRIDEAVMLEYDE